MKRKAPVDDDELAIEAVRETKRPRIAKEKSSFSFSSGYEQHGSFAKAKNLDDARSNSHTKLMNTLFCETNEDDALESNDKPILKKS
jgi:hypothetical protein